MKHLVIRPWLTRPLVFQIKRISFAYDFIIFVIKGVERSIFESKIWRHFDCDEIQLKPNRLRWWCSKNNCLFIIEHREWVKLKLRVFIAVITVIKRLIIIINVLFIFGGVRIRMRVMCRCYKIASWSLPQHNFKCQHSHIHRYNNNIFRRLNWRLAQIKTVGLRTSNVRLQFRWNVSPFNYRFPNIYVSFMTPKRPRSQRQEQFYFQATDGPTFTIRAPWQAELISNVSLKINKHIRGICEDRDPRNT